ncbi:hypothetical protein Mpal_1697 [Methanosphaerula palustris E1-9c]|uniref:Uncharacterized protein n=1 Tax=Methanosphaerula palustris (strain ATCC BAA-1556 / DSM 19958 / E1-9c) TaxID=521011 RepID=B8GJG4_METPE|nr:hypothetical protein Mpal_1697 [Methanosphaerula palustris E1-9c]
MNVLVLWAGTVVAIRTRCQIEASTHAGFMNQIWFSESSPRLVT